MNELISCIMPTWNRRSFVPLAISCFLAQDDEARELVVIDDGSEPVYDLMPHDRRVRYVHLNGRSTIGAKLNFGVRVARGELLALWADDDWHAPWRLSWQRSRLADQPRAEICGSDSILFWDWPGRRAARYWYTAMHRPTTAYMLGGTLFFRRSFWLERQFPDVSQAEDNAFIAGRLGVDRFGQQRAVFDGGDYYVAMLHGGNTRQLDLEHEQFEAVELEFVRELMSGDWAAWDGLRANMAAPPAPAGSGDGQASVSRY